MKKVLAVVAVVAFCASFTSCKKDCECTVKDADGKVVYTQTFPDVKKSDCENTVITGYDTGVECKSK